MIGITKLGNNRNFQDNSNNWRNSDIPVLVNKNNTFVIIVVLELCFNVVLTPAMFVNDYYYYYYYYYYYQLCLFILIISF